MTECEKCKRKSIVRLRVKIYLGHDKDWGHQYTEAWWCLGCVTADSK